MNRRGLVPAIALTLFAATGCSFFEAQPDAPFVIELSAVSDPGQPLEGVGFTLPSGKVAKTDAQGKVKIRLVGNTGDVVPVGVTCPEKYNPINEPLSLTLYHLASGKRATNHEVQCTPVYREVVAAIRAPKGIGVPIMRLGKVLAKTDESGAAHVAVAGRPGEQVDFVLDTTDTSFAWLRPRSPTVSFVIPANDDVVVLDQKFLIEKPPVVKVAPPKKKAEFRPTKI